MKSAVTGWDVQQQPEWLAPAVPFLLSATAPPFSALVNLFLLNNPDRLGLGFEINQPQRLHLFFPHYGFTTASRF